MPDDLADTPPSALRAAAHRPAPTEHSTASSGQPVLTRDEKVALRQMLEYAEEQYGKSQQSYYSRCGWSS